VNKLYIIPTPIGNLKDITLRSIELLKTVKYICAEDTRTTKKLLNHYEIVNQLVSYHQHNEHKIVDKIIEDLLSKDGDIAVVSDAGTPGISDPGFLLVSKAKENNIPVFCLPGPTAFVPALIQSGFPTDVFLFQGFLPHKKGRKKLLLQIKEEHRTIVLYESPHRLLKLLMELKEVFQDNREVSISREITKIHEETTSGTPQELHDYFSQKKVKGEIVVVIKKQ
jgi:16S rRNA (cytidine1402-2'-O)-methyltransferase